MARTLITGGAGFIGSHLVRACLQRGDDVTVLVRAGSDLGRIAHELGQVSLQHVDLMDRGEVKEVMAEARPQVILHLAVRTRFQTAPDLSDLTVANEDHQGFLNLLSSAVTAPSPPDVFVRAGTLAEYGPIETPYRESDLPRPAGTYGLNALMGTQVLQALQARLPFAAATARIALTYGEGQSEDFLVPHLIARCLEGQPADIRNPEDTRDLIYVGDVVDALLRMADGPDAVAGQVINVARGVAPSMREVAQVIAGAVGADPTLLRFGTQIGVTPRLLADATLAEDLLGWRAKTTLKDGIAQTVRWAQPLRAESEAVL